ncbi:Golgi apyrase [Actinomortierella ambigua]|uniref:Golgi apyrase n=1 Tax=Actinomortierella ambigua TaxID=1343610 RepID=A0A9P6PZ56_9FUNG|nr:Golgi apyrase [Actinomortierella ambigua]
MQHDPEWLQHRQFGIVIDAGSSGSRIHIYSWLDKSYLRSSLPTSQLRGILPTIEPGVASTSAHASEWTFKIEPGIADFSNRPADVGEHLEKLLDHAMNVIPESQQDKTPIYLLATAGLRLVADDARRKILDNTCSYIRDNYSFRIGRCEDHIKNISGEEEGLFGWVAINYLMGGFDHGGVKVLHPPEGGHKGLDGDEQHAPGDGVPRPDQVQEDHEEAQQIHRHTLGFLDMGGASTQIAFEPSSPASQAHANDLTKVTIHTLDNQELSYNVFVTTFLGYGTNEARRRYVKDYLLEEQATKELLEKQHPDVRFQIVDPCLPRSLLLNDTHTKPHVPLTGSGSFSKCLEKVEPMLNKQVACYDEPCLFNGVHTPPIDFNVNTFIGVSEYWYSSHDILGLGGAYDYAEFERKSAEFCESDWEAIIQRPEFQDVKHERLEMQCFKSAWLSNVLHGGFGLPRYGEKGYSGTKEQANEVLEQAGESIKGKQWMPTFQSINSIKDIQVTWTLGAMLLFSSGSLEKTTVGHHSHHSPSSDLPPSNHPPPHEETYAERMLDNYNHFMFLAILIFILAMLWICRSRLKPWAIIRRLRTLGSSLSPSHGGPSFFSRLRRTNTGTDYSALEGGGISNSPSPGVFSQRWGPKVIYLAIVHHSRSFWWAISSRLWPEPATYELTPAMEEGIQSIAIGGYDPSNAPSMTGSVGTGAGTLDNISSAPGGVMGYGSSSGLSSIPEGSSAMGPSPFDNSYRTGTPHSATNNQNASNYRQPPKAGNNKFFGGRINKKRFSGDSQSLFKEGFAVNTTGIAQHQAAKSALELTARSGSNNPNLSALHTRTTNIGGVTDPVAAGTTGTMPTSAMSSPATETAGYPWKQGWMPNDDQDQTPSSRDDDLVSPGLPFNSLSSSRSDRGLYGKSQSPSYHRQTPLARYKHLTTQQQGDVPGESHSAPSSTWNLSGSLGSGHPTAITGANNNGFVTSADERDEWSADGGGDGDDEGDGQSSYFHHSHGSHHQHHHASRPSLPYGFTRTMSSGSISSSGHAGLPPQPIPASTPPVLSSLAHGRKRSTGLLSGTNFDSGAGAMTPMSDVIEDMSAAAEAGYQSAGGYSSSGSYHVVTKMSRTASGAGVGGTVGTGLTSSISTPTPTVAPTSSVLLPPGYVPGSRPTSRSVSPLMMHQTASTSTSSLVLGRHNITEMDQQLVSRASSENARRGSLGAVMSP